MFKFKSLLQRQPQQPQPPELTPAKKRELVCGMLYVFQNVEDYDGHKGTDRQYFDSLSPNSFTDADIDRIHNGIVSIFKDHIKETLALFINKGWTQTDKDRTGTTFKKGNLIAKYSPAKKICTISENGTVKKELNLIEIYDYLNEPVTQMPGSL